SQIPTLDNFDMNNLDTVKKTKLNKEIARKNLQKVKGQYLPKVYLDASLQRNIGNDEYKDLWHIGFSVKYNLFDFGARNSQLIQSKLQLKKALIQQREVELKIKEKLVDAVNRIKTAQAKIKAYKKQIKFAKKVEEVEKVKYEEGVSDLYNYLYAKAQRIMAETSYIQAIYERERAVSYLKYILEEYKH
ncbi:MAG: TolC family protein, partial [Aquificae bacterium]|nr:TolC family protein [Aquificota bacterium]